LRRPPRIEYAKLTPLDILRNQYIRLNTIYKIVDVDGNLIPFRMNAEQYHFYKNMHNLNIILKARQLGMTTLIQIYLLDVALFTPNTSCGVIAHNKEDAEKFFDRKIKLAYDNIPADFKAAYVPTADQDRAGQLKFSNGSYITVATSLRSSTAQYLHISEFGKMCAKYPEKAEEVVSGALNAVHAGNWITIESTGEGAHGHFYEMTMNAKRMADRDEQLTEMDYKFFFFPWWESPQYQLAGHIEPDDEDREYFKELARDEGITLTRSQQNWYIKKRLEQRERMWREFPSTDMEAFRGVIEGAPFSRIMSTLRRDRRICKVRWARNYPVNTLWDFGRNDKMAIWFFQHIGFELRFIDYYENNFHGLDHYSKYMLDELPYTYGTHYLPHDAEVVELTRVDAKTREEVLNDLGIEPTIVVPRIALEMEQIDMARNIMGNVWFDEDRCAMGITCLENVRFRFDDRLQDFQPNLMRTVHKHGADAFMQIRGYVTDGQAARHDVKQTNGTALARQSRESSRGRNKANMHTSAARDWRT
jgi:hypothetical protein